jgi:exodeoxyribonuclease III
LLTVATVNVNGIRAALRKGYLDWLLTRRPDVVCLQEVRASYDDLPAAVVEPDGYHATHAASDLKGRAGVAVLSRREPTRVRTGCGLEEFDKAGRYVEAWYDDLVVASVYVPTGEADTARQEEKERFLAGLLDRLVTLRECAGREVLVAGDWNIAHREADLKNWKANRTKAGFLPTERAWFDRLYDEAGYVDVVRALEPEGPGPYTWWSYRGRAFDTDAGWRIDLQVSTPGLAARAVKAEVDRAPSYAQRWSDHAPVVVTYDV